MYSRPDCIQELPITTARGNEIYTVSESTLGDGRSFEHSRDQFQLHFAAARERDTHIGAVYEHWKAEAALCDSGLPAPDPYAPLRAAPESADLSALIDVSSGDPDAFTALAIGDHAVGMRGFSAPSAERRISDRIHCMLLIDLLWVRMDRQPIYIETEIIVDEATARYVYMLLPLLGDQGSVDRIHAVTRPALGVPAAMLEEIM